MSTDGQLLELVKHSDVGELISYVQKRLKEQRDEGDEFVAGTLSYQSVTFEPELEVNIEEMEDSKVYEVYETAEEYKDYLKEKFHEVGGDVVLIGPVVFSRDSELMYVFLTPEEAREMYDVLE
jgi:hypothetical protein